MFDRGAVCNAFPDIKLVGPVDCPGRAGFHAATAVPAMIGSGMVGFELKRGENDPDIKIGASRWIDDNGVFPYPADTAAHRPGLFQDRPGIDIDL